jgi:hypothetical protein
VKDGLEEAIHEMQRIGELLKKISVLADDEVHFRLHEIVSSLEEMVGRSWDVYAGEAPPLELYWDDPDVECECEMNTEWDIDSEWEIDSEELNDHRMK